MGRVARMGKKKNVYKGPLGDLGIDGRIILQEVL
jgi:hypothetical protein